MIFGCGNNISNQIIENASILCCPTQVTCTSEVEEVLIAFSHILWKMGPSWKFTGHDFKDSLTICDDIPHNWKVAMSENRVAAITDSGSVVVWTGGNKWRPLHFQNFAPSTCEPDRSCKQSSPSHGSIEQIGNPSGLDSICSCNSDDEGKLIESQNIDSSLDSFSGDDLSKRSTFKDLCVEDNALLAVKNDGTAYSSTIPVEIRNQHISQIALGKEHHVVLTRDGAVYTWGSGMRGQLGTGELSHSDAPQLVESLQGLLITSVSCGGWHSLACSDAGDIYLWGWNESGQLGFPFKTNYKSSLCSSIEHHCLCPESLCEQTSAMKDRIKNFTEESCQLVRQGADKRINQERCKEIVNVQASPKLLDFWNETISVTEVACGDRHTLFLLDDGSVWAVGMNKYGQLGLSHTESLEEPVEVPIKNVKKIYAGGWNSVFVTRK